MNERIIQLAEQANEYTNSRVNGPSPIWFECFNKKFAELIVKECASLVVDDDNAYDMLKHFGVDN